MLKKKKKQKKKLVSIAIWPLKCNCKRPNFTYRPIAVALRLLDFNAGGDRFVARLLRLALKQLFEVVLLTSLPANIFSFTRFFAGAEQH